MRRIRLLVKNKTVKVLLARKHNRKNSDEEKPKFRVAAYCRVSTDSDEQATSYEAQIEHYTAYINGHPDWTLAGIYADDGISGTNTKKREEFNRMIDECMAGSIDMVITKSISRFARNTLDCLKYIRQLKEKAFPFSSRRSTSIPWIQRVKSCSPLWLLLPSRKASR